MRTLMRSPIESDPLASESQASRLSTNLRQPLPPVRFQTASSSSGPPMASGSHLLDGSAKRSRTATFNRLVPPGYGPLSSNRGAKARVLVPR